MINDPKQQKKGKAARVLTFGAGMMLGLVVGGVVYYASSDQTGIYYIIHIL